MVSKGVGGQCVEEAWLLRLAGLQALGIPDAATDSHVKIQLCRAVLCALDAAQDVMIAFQTCKIGNDLMP